MELWQTIIAATLTLLGLLGGGAKVWMRWRERMAKAQRAHELALEQAKRERESEMAARFESMQRAYFDDHQREQKDHDAELQALLEREARRDEMLERHRSEHLADIKLSAERLHEAVRTLRQYRPDSTSPR